MRVGGRGGDTGKLGWEIFVQLTIVIQYTVLFTLVSKYIGGLILSLGPGSSESSKSGYTNTVFFFKNWCKV